MIFNMWFIVVFLFIYVYVYFLFVFFNTCYNGFLRLIIFVFGNLFWYMIHLFISCYVRFYCLVALFFLHGVLKMISRGISLEDAKREIKTIKKQRQQEQEAQERRQELGRNFEAKRSKQPGPQS